MKKLAISILAAGLAALTLASCGGEAAESTSGSDGGTASVETTTGAASEATPKTNPEATAGTTTQKPAETDTPSTETATATNQTPDPTKAEESDPFGNLFYTIDCDITIVDGNAGIAFSGLSNRDFLMWQLAIGEHNDGNLYLRPHFWLSGTAVAYEEIVINEQDGLENITVGYGETYNMVIRVSDTGVIETLINGVSVYTTDGLNDLVLTDELGAFGFRCAIYGGGGTPEVGVYDNLKITDAAGAVLYEDDFSDENSLLCSQLLTDNRAVLEDGALKVTGNSQGFVGMIELAYDN